ncbi:NYN domain-containing protein [Bradyrhizobium sp. CCBAU 51753]|uniref:LabA-like NYN domain-containing protein n=1 Tax=Bradyrhizobium sp. CCBAU 51753 TaxID=1325100 RepID=UPI00188A18F3|nr:NYN domain-containing protein [Bradyrhizobium sp. CCBAU 51753]QOZ24198.1 NYN domain-containing protein [Bradyrhizobium sp. CCBAU 51753]
MSPFEKIALLIDSPKPHATARALGFEIDYKRLLREFKCHNPLLRPFCYTPMTQDQEYSAVRPLLDWLDYYGYALVTTLIEEFVDDCGRRKVKGNMDVEFAVDAMELVECADRIIPFSGDSDFCRMVEAVRRRGVHVTAISTIAGQSPMIADELRRQADESIDLTRLKLKVERDPFERSCSISSVGKRRDPADAE